MARLERQETVLNLLKELRGLDPLKQLFWTELNYERINKSLSRRNWTETAAKALADDPVLFAAGGEDEGFHVIYSRLSSDVRMFLSDLNLLSARQSITTCSTPSISLKANVTPSMRRSSISSTSGSTRRGACEQN